MVYCSGVHQQKKARGRSQLLKTLLFPIFQRLNIRLNICGISGSSSCPIQFLSVPPPFRLLADDTEPQLWRQLQQRLDRANDRGDLSIGLHQRRRQSD